MMNANTGKFNGNNLFFGDGFLFKGLKERSDHQEHDKGKGKGGKDGPGLETFEPTRPEQYGGGYRLDDSPSELHRIRRIQTSVGG